MRVKGSWWGHYGKPWRPMLTTNILSLHDGCHFFTYIFFTCEIIINFFILQMKRIETGDVNCWRSYDWGRSEIQNKYFTSVKFNAAASSLCCPLSSWAHEALAWLVPVSALYSSITLNRGPKDTELGHTQSRGPLEDGCVHPFKGIGIQWNIKAMWFYLPYAEQSWEKYLN